MRVVFIGCVDLSHALLAHLLTLDSAQVVGVVTRQASLFNADFRSLAPLAEAAGVPCYIAAGNRQEEMAAWIAARAPDVVYCIGWSYLLRTEILSLPRLGVIGYHPTLLPRNRGRHPIIWTLVLGLQETGSTFFFMDEGADTGDILSQERVPVYDTDDAAVLYARLQDVAKGQVAAFTAQLADGTYPRLPQDHTGANSWRKRSKEDGAIDWRMPAGSVYNLVRALARPYPGAHCVWRGEEVKVWRAEGVGSSVGKIDHLEPGKVLRVEAGAPVVKCGSGALRILEHTFDTMPEEGQYIR